MMRRLFLFLVLFGITLVIFLTKPSIAQDWQFRAKPRGTLKVVALQSPPVSIMHNYAEGLVMLDKNNDPAPCLAEDYRWIDDRTIEFKLREGVRFHNGEKFNAEAVRVNWEEYRKLENPRVSKWIVLPDETVFQIIDEYTVRFSFPEPDGISFAKFLWFFQFAPAFFNRIINFEHVHYY